MGNYKPSEHVGRGSVEETLNAAEADHFLDCPPAELKLRIAALLLDLLFSTLALSGIQSLCTALQSHLQHLGLSVEADPFSSWDHIKFYLSLNAGIISSYIFISSRLAFLYFYFIWALTFSGGSPGKLILGLRVVQERNGTFPPLGISVLREVTKVLSISLGGLGIFYFFLSKKKTFFHDSFWSTTVKRIHGRV